LFDRFDPSILWVSPASSDHGTGTYDEPFSCIDQALALAKPGTTIVLKSGKYSRNVTMQVSGTLRQPIRIYGEEGAEVTNACWFLYDVSNMVISQIGFRNAPQNALSVIGACSHNRFSELTFVDCGAGEKSSCTLFFGGSGGTCNVVEQCRFEQRPGGESSIAVMAAEGDNDRGQAIMNLVFRKNTFVNYTTGIVVGVGDAPAGQYGHLIEYNTFAGCAGDALIIKCGDTQIRGNLVKQCAATAIAVRAGSNSVIEANRIVDSKSGISLCGPDHSIGQNCLIRCSDQGILATGNGQGNPATGLFIENNTFVKCGTPDLTAAVIIEKGASGILRMNLFNGFTDLAGPVAQFLVSDNVSTGQAGQGIEQRAVVFKDPGKDDFSNDSGYGASGWMVTDKVFDPHADDIDPENDYCAVDIEDDTQEDQPVAEEAGFESFMGQFYLKGMDGEGKDPE
jgi:hypothetical protein